jgi:hypothetical protein
MNRIFLDAALRYAELGYRVFPCVPGESHPLTEHGFLDATTDAVQIERWGTQQPNAQREHRHRCRRVAGG